MNKRNSFDEESFLKSYEQNIDHIQDVVDLFCEYYCLLVDSMGSKDKDCRQKENQSSSEASMERKLKIAKARAAALLLLKGKK